MMIAMRALLLLLIASTAAAEPWQVTDQTKGVETEIHTADVPLDLILTGLDDGPLIVRSHPERVTGDVVAPSPHGAVVAAFAAAGVQVPKHVVVDRSPAATIDVQFIDAPPEDLFRLIADTLHVNIVFRGGAPLPRVSIRLKRAPADEAMKLIALVVGLEVKREGNMFFLLPKGEPLPPHAKTSDAVVELDSKNAPAKLVAAAVAAVTGTKPLTCSDALVNLHVRRVAMFDVARALEVHAGALAPGDCALAPSKVDIAKLKLVAIAGAGTKRIAAGTVDGKPVLVASGDGVEVGQGYVSAGDKSQELHPSELDLGPINGYADWRARILRTMLVVRKGKTWSAIFEITNHGIMTADHVPEATVAIDAKGVTVTYDGKSELIPLRK